MEIIKYEHHGKNVSVFKELKGLHAKHCLCYTGCKYFHPNTDENCSIAQELFEFDCRNEVTTPVWECEKYTNEK